MSQIDTQLVQMIADEVMRALASAEPGAVTSVNVAKTPDSQSSAQSASGSIPMGMCEAAPEPKVQPSQCSMPSASVPSQAEPQGPVLSGFVTAYQLTDALKASVDGVVTLDAAARLTPLAQDMVRRKPQSVRRLGLSEDLPANVGRVVSGLPWIWWTCGRCAAVTRIVEERRARLLPSAIERQGRMIAAAVRDVADAVAQGKAAGGLLFVSKAARAMCLANRRRSLRAILGNCDDAVSMGIEEIGANVLVLEFPFNNYEQMARRVDLMMNSRITVPADLRAMLVEMEGKR